MNGLLEKNVSESAPIATLPIGTYREIPLTQGKVAIVDPEDYEWLSQWNWYARFSKGAWYVLRAGPKVKGKCHSVYMHRVIMQTPDGMQTDHINGNGLDNRRENMRSCNCAQNQYNQQKQKRATSSRFKGVSWDGRKYRAYIKVAGECISLGRFASEVQAALTYDEAARRYFGEFAYTNFKANRAYIQAQKGS